MPSGTIASAARGFVDDPGTVLLVLFGLLALVLALLAVFVLQNRRMRSRLELQSEQAYSRALARLDLTPEERALVERLASLVGDPATRRHLVLTNPNTFNHCAARLVSAGRASETAVAALRVKLGFARSSVERRVTSTAILPVGLRLFVVQRETKKFYATVKASTPAGLVVDIQDPQIVAPGPGTELRCYFNVRNGTFHFATVVEGLDGQTLRLRHSESIARTQRRRYYRARTHIAARVTLAGSAEPPLPTHILDLSGGGATIENPGFRFDAGDDVQLLFKTPDGAEYRLIAEVRRLSSGGRLLHAAFGPMSDAIRDRLVAFVLGQRRRHGAAVAGEAAAKPADPGSGA